MSQLFYCSVPMTRGSRFDATKQDLAIAREKQNQLNQMKRTWMIRRTKSKTISDQLPRKNDQVVFCSLSPFQVIIFNLIWSWTVDTLPTFPLDKVMCDLMVMTSPSLLHQLSSLEGNKMVVLLLLPLSLLKGGGEFSIYFFFSLETY